MHRVVMERKLGRKLKPTELVDHRKGNKLDNRRSQLRLSTGAQNQQNTQAYKKAGSSKFLGVVWNKDRGKWQANISHEDRTIDIGLFTDEREAAYVRDQWALQLRGRVAVLDVL